MADYQVDGPRPSYRLYFGTSRGGEWLNVTFENADPHVNLEAAIYRSSPLVMSAARLRDLADALDEVAKRYDEDQLLARKFDAWRAGT